MSADTTTPTLFDSDAELRARIEALETELKTERAEATRLGDLYSRYRKEAAQTTDRTRALIRKEAWEALRSTDVSQQPLVNEIKWLRHYIVRAGRDLHRQFGDPNPPIGGWCRCLGCELIVATDLREPGDVPDGELGSRFSLQQRLIEAETERDRARNALAAYKACSPKPERT
jgi:hypothetical protein